MSYKSLTTPGMHIQLLHNFQWQLSQHPFRVSYHRCMVGIELNISKHQVGWPSHIFLEDEDILC